jgi:hypothetical protein
MGKKVLKELQQLHNDVEKNKIILDKEKEKFINQIKQMNKEDMFPKPPETPKKLTIWQRLHKVLMG